MSSIFSKIIRGEIPAFKIAENENFVAFLDVFPLVKGHVLVVPKIEVDKLHDLSDEILKDYFVFAKPIAKAMEKCLPCKRVGYSVVGLEVPHAHLHLVPISNVNDLNFTREKLPMTTDELKKVQELILAHL